jgi:hypothetical protein
MPGGTRDDLHALQIPRLQARLKEHGLYQEHKRAAERRFQISVFLNAPETTVSQARVYRTSALLGFYLDYVVALPFGAHRHYRPRQTFAESPMKSDSSISRRVRSDFDSI